MKRMMAAAAVALLAAIPWHAARGAEGDPTPPWSLKFTHGALDVITVSYRDGSSRLFYYMTFTLENAGATDAPLGLHVKAVVGSDPRKQRVHYALPAPDAEEYVRRLSRSTDLLNVHQINTRGGTGPSVLKQGEKINGIAVFGTFDREWDTAKITFSGLEPRSLQCRVHKYADGSFTFAHRAYREHNEKVIQKAGEDKGLDVYAILQHDIVWSMDVRREGDEFQPQMDFAGRVALVSEGWTVVEDPAPKIVLEKEPPFRK